MFILEQLVEPAAPLGFWQILANQATAFEFRANRLQMVCLVPSNFLDQALVS